MKTVLIIVLLLALLHAAAFAQQTDTQMKMARPEKPVALLSGLGYLHHPVSTKDSEAQRFFDQGLSLVFAFNHEEAIRSFKRAAELDPQMAMAWWGGGAGTGS